MTQRQHPAVPPGWTRVYVQIPAVLAEILRVAAEAEGHGGLKLVTTAAIAAFLALPAHERAAATAYVGTASRRDPGSISPESVASEIEQARINASAPSHYVDRILDPELSPKPGDKMSDRASKPPVNARKKGA